MADIRTLTTSLKILRHANVSGFIWGDRGLGKSSLVKQYAQAGLGETMEITTGKAKETIPLPMGFIDMRCSQLEASDLRGLPDKHEGRTVFYPPADMPFGDMEAAEIEEQIRSIKDAEERRIMREKMRPHYKNGVLFLDELNRAADDVLQAAFQLVLDRRVGDYVLPSGWQVVVAGNYTEGYQVNGFTDPAFIDRFCHLDLSSGEPTLHEWVQYMANTHGPAASPIIQYCSSNLKNLDGDTTKSDKGFSRTPSRRSWDSAARCLDAAAKLNLTNEDKALTDVLAGLLGREAAIAFQRHNSPVQPLEILKNGVEPFRDALTRLQRGQLLGVCWGVVSYAKDKVKTDKRVAEICLDLAEHLLETQNDRDIPVAFCRNLINSDDANNALYIASLTNPTLAKMLNKVETGSNVFLSSLSQRKKLQDLITKFGWGVLDKK